MTEDHLPLDELAELAEGLLSDERSSAARAHVAGCAQCQELMASLEAATAALHDLPPVTMPADVAARLERALADEAPLSATTDPTGGGETPPSSVTVVPDVSDIRQHRRWGMPSAAASAAAAVVVLLVGGIVVAALHHHGSSNSEEASGSTSAASSSSSSSAGRPVGNNTSKDFAEAATNRVYDHARLASQVSSLLANVHRSASASGSSSAAASSAPGSGASETTPPPSSTYKAPVPANPSLQSGSALSSTKEESGSAIDREQSVSHAKLLSCAAALATTPDAVPLAVDFARWTGGAFHNAPSIVVVFNGPQPDTLAVYVVGPTCDPNEIRTYSIVSRSG